MSFEAQRVYLSNKMKMGWNNYLPCSYPNTTFNIPADAVYCEFHMISGQKPVTISGEGVGKVRNRYVGFVQLTVWIPEKKGTKDATLAGDKFRDIFNLKQGRDSACSLYRFGVIQEFTPTVKAGWECIVYRVPYEKDIVEQIQVSI